MSDLDPTEIEELSAVLYRTDWQADLYATPRGSYTYRYERRAEKVLVSDWLKKRDAEIAARALEKFADKCDETARAAMTTEAAHFACAYRDHARDWAVGVRKDGEQ